jgi:hypothetical protein
VTVTVTVTAAGNRHHGPLSTKSKETQYGDNDNHETDKIDDVVH